MTDEVKNLGEPLTLEQMRGMRGKWAWIVSCDESKPFFGWGLVGKHHASTLQEYDEDLAVRVNYDVEEYGSVWLAYRYPPVATDTDVGSILDEWEPCWTCRNDSCRTCKSSGVDSLGDPCYKCNCEEGAPEYEPSNFCPECGRPLTGEARTMLEKRLRGCTE